MKHTTTIVIVAAVLAGSLAAAVPAFAHGMGPHGDCPHDGPGMMHGDDATGTPDGDALRGLYGCGHGCFSFWRVGHGRAVRRSCLPQPAHPRRPRSR